MIKNAGPKIAQWYYNWLTKKIFGNFSYIFNNISGVMKQDASLHDAEICIESYENNKRHECNENKDVAVLIDGNRIINLVKII